MVDPVIGLKRLSVWKTTKIFFKFIYKIISELQAGR